LRAQPRKPLDGGAAAGECVFQPLEAAVDQALATAYSHPALRENMVSLVGKLEFCRIVLGRLDKSFRDELFQNSPLMGFEIRAGAREQIAKDRDF
jgi:hypothetical protein